MEKPDSNSARRWRDRESGQATVEFALILLPLLTVVAGIIYFGIGLNYWLDMNRVANQGARAGAVNSWPPQCVRGDSSCNSSTSATPCSTVLGTSPPFHTKARLQDVLRCQARNASTTTVALCFPGKTPGGIGNAAPNRGDPVKLTLTAPYKFFFIDAVHITLTASATMRMEQSPSLITGGGGPSC